MLKFRCWFNHHNSDNISMNFKNTIKCWSHYKLIALLLPPLLFGKNATIVTEMQSFDKNWCLRI
jgi:hypothetical protein